MTLIYILYGRWECEQMASSLTIVNQGMCRKLVKAADEKLWKH